MNLYVWEGVLADYTDGIAFALARDADHARWLIVRRVPTYQRSTVRAELKRVRPRVFSSPKGFAVWGGA